MALKHVLQQELNVAAENYSQIDKIILWVTFQLFLRI